MCVTSISIFPYLSSTLLSLPSYIRPFSILSFTISPASRSFSSLSPHANLQFIPLIVYHGDRGRYHYYQCLQLLLRLQIKSLTAAWHLPPEFEVRSLFHASPQLSYRPSRNPTPFLPQFPGAGLKWDITNETGRSGLSSTLILQCGVIKEQIC